MKKHKLLSREECEGIIRSWLKSFRPHPRLKITRQELERTQPKVQWMPVTVDGKTHMLFSVMIPNNGHWDFHSQMAGKTFLGTQATVFDREQLECLAEEIRAALEEGLVCDDREYLESVIERTFIPVREWDQSPPHVNNPDE